MKKLIVTLFILFAASISHADSVFIDGFEYGNHDGETPVGWEGSNNSWLCGYLEQDHNRSPHSGNWYAYTNSAESWMFMPLFMDHELKYRFSLWAVSDGGFQLEIWAGNAASSSAMTQLLLDDIVSSGSYEKFSTYVEDLASDYQYFGIHAVQSYCGDCILTIDDVIIDMVGKYDIAVEPTNYYTVTLPGTQVEFNCRFKNLGYEPANVIVRSYSDSFTGTQLFLNGTACTTFHAEPDESFDFTGVATLNPDVQLGTQCFVDIMFSLDCDCATAMYTLWATAGYESAGEYTLTTMSIYPNPSNGTLTIEGNGNLTISNVPGQVVLQKQLIEKEEVNLGKGVYFVKVNEMTKKVIVQ